MTGMGGEMGGEEQAAGSERLRNLRARRKATRWLDQAQPIVVSVWLAIVVTGLWPPAHGAARGNSPALTSVGVLLVLTLAGRLIADPVTPLRELPLLVRLGEVLERPLFTSARFVPWAASGFVAIMGAVSVCRHATFGSSTFDLGLFENVVWNTVHGRFLWSDVLGRSFLGEHVSPVLLAVALPYALIPRAPTLLVLQAAALAAGAFPLARLARRELDDPPLTAALVVAYLAYLPLRNVARFDFHPVALATPLLLEAFVSFREGRWRRGVWAWGLALACDEAVAAPAAALGLYVLLVLRRRRLGFELSAFAVLWFVAAVLVIVPAFRHGPYPFFDRLGSLRTGRWLALVSLDRFALLGEVLAPLAFLPLLSPVHAALALPSLMLDWLSDSRHQHSIAFHYTATVTPLLFCATVLGIAKLVEREDLRVVLAFYPTIPDLKRYAAVLLLLGAIVFTGWSPVAQIRAGWGAARDDRAAAVARVPAGAPVSAQAHLGAHLARRRGVALFPERLAPWILVDEAGPPWPLARQQDLASWTMRLNADPGCRLDTERGAVRLFACDPPALARLGPSDAPARP